MPPELAAIMVAFQRAFSKPVFRHAQILVMGALLAPGRRTVASVLRVMGLAHATTFQSYHRVLSRATWSARHLARTLLLLLVDRFAGDPATPIVVGLDDTIERRRGPRIAAKGIYRDPVRSSRGHFVKASGLRWLALMLLVPVPWAKRVWALPFLTVLCPSERYHSERGLRHKRLTDWARQALFQVRRWLPQRRLVAVCDSGFAALDLLSAVREQVTVVTRLRLDAALFEPAPPRAPGTVGRPRKKGERLPKLVDVLDDPATTWQRLVVSHWYGRRAYEIEITTGVAVWTNSGRPAVPIRWVLVRDPAGRLDPKAFLSTDPEVDPLEMLTWFVRRWTVEVTFEEVRRHLGVETQRQWSERAIVRTTPCLLGLFSVVALVADRLDETGALSVAQSSWYEKEVPTFSDALAAVRRSLWRSRCFVRSGRQTERVEIPRIVYERLTETLCYAA